MVLGPDPDGSFLDEAGAERLGDGSQGAPLGGLEGERLLDGQWLVGEIRIRSDQRQSDPFAG